MRSKGFVVGALGGLALGLMLVGVTLALPQTNPGVPTANTQAMSFVTSAAISVGSNSTCVSTQGICMVLPPYANATPSTGISAANVSQPSGSNTSSLTTSGYVAPEAMSTTTRVQEPDSLLAALPGESVASIIATISPVLVALVVAVLVYGAYSRRQDDSP